MKQLLTTAALLLCSFCLFAQTQFSLDDCYRLSLERNLTLKQAQNNIAANIIDVKTAQYKALPSLSYSISHYFSFGKNIDPVTNTYVSEHFSGGYTGLNLQLQLFSGFNRLYSVKQSAYMVQASEYAKKNTELELLSNVTLVYARLLLDKEQLAAQRNNIRSLEKEIETINEKIKLGRLSKYEYYTFDSRLNSELATLTELQNDSLEAAQDLKQLLNISYKESLDITPIDSASLSAISATTVSAASLMDTVLQSHPAIKEAQMNELAAQLRVKIAKSNAYPSLSVGGNISSNYNANETGSNGNKVPLREQLNNNLGQNIYIGIHIPLFSQLENASRVKKEKINADNAKLSVQMMENTIATNVLRLVNDFAAAKKQYAAAFAAWHESQLSYNLYAERYRLGQLSSVELLASRDYLTNALSRYLQAKLQLFFRFRILDLLKRQ